MPMPREPCGAFCISLSTPGSSPTRLDDISGNRLDANDDFLRNPADACSRVFAAAEPQESAERFRLIQVGPDVEINEERRPTGTSAARQTEAGIETQRGCAIQ